MPRSYFFINLILLIIIVLLGFRFYKAWTRPLDIPTQTTQRQFQKDRKSLADRKEVNVNKAAYNVIVQKDLFRPSRTAAPQADSNRPSFPKNPPKLFGTMIINNENLAILEDPSTKITKLYHVNDSVAGFIISDIQKDKVIFVKGVEKIEVKLRVDKGIRSSGPSLHLPKTPRKPKKYKPRRSRTGRQP